MMLTPGMMLQDRYEILERIGSGGMSDVYKAKCHKLNRLVGIKVLKKEYTSDAGFVSKFKMEAQAAAGLSHPNIVNIYDVVDEMDLHCIVMELVEGITLKSYIAKKGHLEVKETIGIAIQVAQGITVAVVTLPETAFRGNEDRAVSAVFFVSAGGIAGPVFNGTVPMGFALEDDLGGTPEDQLRIVSGFVPHKVFHGDDTVLKRDGTAHQGTLGIFGKVHGAGIILTGSTETDRELGSIGLGTELLNGSPNVACILGCPIRVRIGAGGNSEASKSNGKNHRKRQRPNEKFFHNFFSFSSFWGAIPHLYIIYCTTRNQICKVPSHFCDY